MGIYRSRQGKIVGASCIGRLAKKLYIQTFSFLAAGKKE
jgi:hypothetical protein